MAQASILLNIGGMCMNCLKFTGERKPMEQYENSFVCRSCGTVRAKGQGRARGVSGIFGTLVMFALFTGCVLTLTLWPTAPALVWY